MFILAGFARVSTEKMQSNRPDASRATTGYAFMTNCCGSERATTPSSKSGCGGDAAPHAATTSAATANPYSIERNPMPAHPSKIEVQLLAPNRFSPVNVRDSARLIAFFSRLSSMMLPSIWQTKQQDDATSDAQRHG